MSFAIQGDSPNSLPREQLRRTILIVLVGSIALAFNYPLDGRAAAALYLSIGPVVVTITDLLVAVTAALLFLGGILRIPRLRGLEAYAVFLVFVTGSLFVTGPTADGIVELIQWFEMIVLSLVIVNLARTEDDVKYAIWTLILIGTVKAFYSLFYTLSIGTFSGRLFTELEGLSLVLVLGILISHRFSRRFAIIAGLLSIEVLYFQERKVWLAVVGALSVGVVLLYLRQRSNQREILLRTLSIAAMIGVAAFAIALLMPEVANRLKTLRGLLNNPRLYIWETSIRMSLDNPVFGVGPDNWLATKDAYSTPELRQWETRYSVDALIPHSIFFRLMSEVGIPGFLAFFYFLSEPLRGVVRISRQSVYSFVLVLGYLYSLVIAGTAAASFEIRAPIFILAGLLFAQQVNGE
ncbi:O-antigen ligase family protein [Halomicrobium sp. HM KBTZ05]|uniref:O-antigen ligase family protein n=1 Tax=Halomicrobium sp. HM KBTZ05 TaxID=3242663 RepID=UPI003558B3B9